MGPPRCFVVVALCVVGCNAAPTDAEPECTRDVDGDDARACNGAETCVQGSCAAGAPLDCARLDGDCVVGTCDAGACVTLPRADGSPCDDGDGCTADDACASGVCTGAVRDDDGDGVSCRDACDDDPSACGADCFPGHPAGDVCDGLDNDCDAATADGAAERVACDGGDVDLCARGHTRCDGTCDEVPGTGNRSATTATTTTATATRTGPTASATATGSTRRGAGACRSPPRARAPMAPTSTTSPCS